ncbi:MAG: dihydrofolate reductase family protein [Acidimicrobiia bacterium]
MRVLRDVHGPTPEAVVAEHVALPATRPDGRAFVRLNMISSVDGGSVIAGVSGGLGNVDDHAVFQALRDSADAVMVGLGTAVAEHYHPPTAEHLRVYVIADVPDVSGNTALFESCAATIVLPEDAPAAPPGVPELRAGSGGMVDLAGVATTLAGQVVVLEGGPSLAGVMVSLGLVDEFFVTLSPRVIAGGSARVVHGPDADAAPWTLDHGFVDDDGYLFLRYACARDR